MSGILDKFHVEHSPHGFRVMAKTQQLTNHLLDNQDIDAMIALLKDDLDACGREIKRLIAINSRGGLFEGWSAET